jgi:hypothetical protein
MGIDLEKYGPEILATIQEKPAGRKYRKKMMF